MRKYTSDHEWIDVDGNEVTVGITDYAVNQLGDLVFVGLPTIGSALKKGDTAATVESVKAASDIYAPLDGIVSAINERLGENPSLVNERPLADGWFIKLVIKDKSQLDDLLDESGYAALTGAV